MTADLRELVRLQALMLELRELEEQLDAVPDEIAALDVQQQAAKQRFAQAEQSHNAAGREHRQLEIELKEAEDKVLRYKKQLMDVSSNDEYKVLNREVEHETKRISEIEDRILAQMESAESQEQELAAARSLIDVAENERSTNEQRLEKKAEQLRAERARLDEQCKALEQTLPSQLLSLYKRRAAARGGLGLAPIKDGSCGVCRLRARPQMLSELRAGAAIIECESCQRMLFFEEESTST